MKDRKVLEYGIVTVLSIVAVMILMAMFLGNNIWSGNPYNTYALQADSWRQGRLHLGQDYPWLELAIYNGKYYCSFPPFPSYVLLPLTFIFGSNTPDFTIMYMVNVLLTVYLFRLAIKLGTNGATAMFMTLFVTVGANTLFIMQEPSVWFFAQLLCFTTATMAIYYAYEGKGGVAMFWWACSVGCRPMQLLFLPILLVLMYQRERKQKPDVSGMKLILQRWYWAIPMGMVALSYMLLNYLRFGSITEFGRKYLPEFVRAEKGQFHVDYILPNLKSLLNFPEFDENGRMIIDHFGNLNFLITSPIVIAAMVGIVCAIYKKEWKLMQMGVLVCILSCMYLLVTVMHRTMGAWQFGNRYAIDILPYIFMVTGLAWARFPRIVKYFVPMALFSAVLNVVGTIIVYNGL